MSKITSDDVRRLAALAKLSLTDDEIKSLEGELASILKMIDEINSYDTEDVEPTYQVSGLKHVVRDDELKDYGATAKDLVSGAAETDGDSLKVPSVK